MVAIREEITIGAVRSYARACIQVQELTELLGHEGFEYMVVPSRGAAPIEHAASTYFHMVRKFQETDTAARMRLVWDYTCGPLCNPLYLPFTADIPPEETGVSSAEIRSFWAKVLAAVVRGDLADPHYRFYAFLRSDVCRVGFPHVAEERLRSGRFVFLDTVVSGRAISEIIAAFDEIGLTECVYVLLVDEGGAKLAPQIRTQLEILEQQGRAHLVYLDRLFTEDRGPAMSGSGA